MNASFLRAMMEDADVSPAEPKIAADVECVLLRDALANFNTRHRFEVGMIVRQKKDCRAYKNLSNNGLSIVVELLPQTIISPFEAGSNNSFEPLDMIVGERVRDGALALYHVDSRRFEPAGER